MGPARKPQAPKAKEPRLSDGPRKDSAERVFPPEAYVFHDEARNEVVQAIQKRADAELAGDELVVIEGDGGND